MTTQTSQAITAPSSDNAETGTHDHIGPIKDQTFYMGDLIAEARCALDQDLPRSLATIAELHQVLKDVVFNIAVEIGRRSKP